MIRVESEETQDYVTISAEEAKELVVVPVLVASHEEPFTSATIAAVKKTFDTGSLRRWCSEFCVSSAKTSGGCSRVSRG